MLTATYLMLSTPFYSPQMSTGSCPKQLSPEEERHYLPPAAQGDLKARNILIERLIEQPTYESILILRDSVK